MSNGSFWVDLCSSQSHTPSGSVAHDGYFLDSIITSDQTVIRNSYSGYIMFPVTVCFGSSGLYFGSFDFSYYLNLRLENLDSTSVDCSFYYSLGNPEILGFYDGIRLTASYRTNASFEQDVFVDPNESVDVGDSLYFDLAVEDRVFDIKSNGLFYPYTFQVKIPFTIGCDNIDAMSNGLGSLAHRFSVKPNNVNFMNKLYLIRYGGLSQSGGLALDDYYFNQEIQSGIDDLGDQVSGSVDAAKEQAHADAQQAHQDAEQAHQDSKNIFDKISDFFGSFFQNIINAVKSLFIPSDDELSSFMGDMKDFLTDKLGFLAYPFEILGKLVDLVAKTGSSTLTLPGFSIMGHTVWDEITYDLSDGLSPFSTLLDAIKVGTSVIIVGAFLMYCQKKFNEVLGGASE